MTFLHACMYHWFEEESRPKEHLLRQDSRSAFCRHRTPIPHNSPKSTLLVVLSSHLLTNAFALFLHRISLLLVLPMIFALPSLTFTIRHRVPTPPLPLPSPRTPNQPPPMTAEAKAERREAALKAAESRTKDWDKRLNKGRQATQSKSTSTSEVSAWWGSPPCRTPQVLFFHNMDVSISLRIVVFATPRVSRG